MAFIKAHKLLVAVITVVVVGGGYAVLNVNSKPSDEVIATVEKHDISQEVNVTGKVRAADNVDLAFEKGGRIAALYADVGDEVSLGSTLAALESADLRAQLLQAQATVKAEEAKLAKLKEGTRPEEILISETKVLSAKATLAGAKTTLENAIQDAFTKSDDAIRNKTDQFFSNPNSSNPQLLFATTNSQLKNEVEQGRTGMGPLLTNWQNAQSSALDGRTTLTDSNLQAVQSFLDKVALVINGASAGGNVSQTTLDSWKSAVSTARTNINTALTNFIASKNTYDDAKLALTLAEQRLALDRAGAVLEDLLAQEAALEQAEANVANLQAQLSKTILRAPFSGVVTRRDIKVGEIATAGVALISLISEDLFEITANVPEADIAKMTVGAQARVTLDAYGDDVPFSASVTKIDPAETVIDGVSTYEVTFHFSEKDSRIRSGMTADIDVVTSTRISVLAIPSRLIAQENGDKVVYVMKAGLSERRVVTTGIKGIDGYIEILSGLSEGESVVTNP